MAIDSASRGFLTPILTASAEDADLDDLFRETITALSGLDAVNVWPKWQGDGLAGDEPAQPPRGITWCAFGVIKVESDLNPSIVHDGCADGRQGRSTTFRTERLDLLCSFYGPACRAAATALQYGIRDVGQNRAALKAKGIAYNGSDPIRSVPDLQNQAYVRRADLLLRMSRVVVRTYAIRNVVGLSGDGAVIIDGQYVTGPATLADPL